MAGTLTVGQLVPDVGTNLYINAQQYGGNVIVGNTTTTLVNIGTSGNVTFNGVITGNTITSNGASLVLQSNNTTAITVDTSQNVTFAGSVNAPNSFGFKNRIINGAQGINQRNATVTTGSTYVTDRWQVDNISTSGSVSFAQNTTAPAGFTYSLKITVTSADAAVGATDLIDFRQWIEGYNVADMGFGTSNSNYFTCSFWVNSSQTGTYGISFRNSDSSRVYVSTYTVNSANIWEQKTVTIPVDTSGTWLTDNSRGLGIAFTVMAGSNYQGTAGSWGVTNNRTTSAQANLLANNGATFYITGVQLEKGSTATSFDYRPYSAELAMCQRYCYKISTSGGYSTYATTGMFISTTRVDFPILFPTYMRASPTGTYTAANTYLPSSAGTDFTPSAVASVAGSASPQAITVTFTVSGATAGRAATLTDLSSTASNMIFSAEL